MKKVFILIVTLIVSLQVYSQKELKEFYDLDIQVISDTIYYDSFFENDRREVKIKAYDNNILETELHLSSAGFDNDVLTLREVTVINYIQDVRKMYIWDPNYGEYYIGKIAILNNRMSIDKSYSNYDDESVNGFSDYTTSPETDIKYKKGTYFLDLSIVKTFPAYFKKLYEEKYLKDNSQKQ